MDIMTAHQQGLIEHLNAEAEALAGRAKDFGQRAVVLHHLFDHSVGGHGWALLEARRQLDCAKAIDQLRKKARGIWLRRRKREQACEAVELLASALGVDAQNRFVAAYKSYRMTATAALEEEASAKLPPEFALLLGECHARRRAGVPLTQATRAQLAAQTEAAMATNASAAQWAAVSATPVGGKARKLIRETVGDGEFAKVEKKGWDRMERAVRTDPSLPAAFRANPAQHFYALQNSLAEKKRKEMRDACDAECGMVELAA